MHLTLVVWAALVLVAAAAEATDVKGRGLVDMSDHQPPEDLKEEDPLPWKAKVTPAWTGLPVRVTLEVKGVLGTGSLYLAGGDGTSFTFLASGHPARVAGSPPTGHTDRERKKEQIAQRGGDNNSGLGYQSHPVHSRWPPAGHEFHGDTTHPAASPVVCPLFAMADKNYGGALRTPVYDLACREGVDGLILEATHVYTDPGKYQVDAHFLDELLGVVTGRWEAKVEVEELLQVTLGPSRALPLQDGHAVASATLSLTPSLEPLPLPCPGGLISWAWDFGDGTGEEGGECTSEEREKEEEERMTQERKSGEGEDSDFLRNTEKRTENFIGMEESGGEEKKKVESTDKRAVERRTAEGLKEQKKDSPDSTASSLSYFTPSTSTSATATSSSISTFTSTTDVSEDDKHDSDTAGTSPPSPPPSPTPSDAPSSTSDGSISTVSSVSTISTLTTTSGPDDVSFTTTSTITTPIPTQEATANTVYHTYTAPGIYNMSVQLLCGCRRIAGKDIRHAFTVAVPIGDVQISVSETHLLLLQDELGHPAATQEVVMTVKVTNGSFLYPVTLHTDDGTQVLLQPTLSDPAGLWLAEAKHKYQLPGEYQPWVEVGNPVGGRQAALHTVIKVDQPPNSVVLVPDLYVAAIGEEVVFTAKASGTLSPLHYDWVLPGGEILKDAGSMVARTYSSPFQDSVSVEVYYDAHAHMPTLPRPQATALVTVEAPLNGVQLLVDDKDTDIILPKNRIVYLKAVISPPEALDTSRFYWYRNHALQRWTHQGMHYQFSTPGEVSLQVVVENQNSHVESTEVRVLVVERIGDVRGLADHDSVLVRQARNYTVLVGHGSNITYTWHFGDFLDTVNTTVPTKAHTYWIAGTYTLTVRLTTPLGDLHVVTSKVFVLNSGKCDTPKVLGFYPKDASTEREFNMTQEILVEPELLRDCPLGSGPKYLWTVWDEDGQEVRLPNTRLDTPSLLIHPVYDHDWPPYLRTDAAKKALDTASSFLQEEENLIMGGLAPRTLEDGKYTTQLTVRERDTIVEASFNTTFRVVATRLRVTFVDGTEREVDRDANVTLRVKVASPSPNYTLHWDCSPLDIPGASCFSQPGILNTFPTTTYIGDNIFSRLHHLWELLHNTSNNDTSSNQTKGISYTWHQFSPSHSSSSFLSPSEEGDSYFLNRVFNTSQHYIVSLTFPASILVSSYNRFHFSASVKEHSTHPVNVSQLVVVESSRDNIGIQTCLGSQLPFGALRRMVFESECMSCSPEELAALQYSWSLNMLVNDQNTAVLDWEGQQTTADEAEVTLQRALRRTEVDGSFLPRPSDYLRMYNRSTLQEGPTQTAPEEDSNPDLASPTPHLSTNDLQNLPGVITPEILAQAAEIYHRWGRLGPRLRLPSQDASGDPHKLRGSRMKRSLDQDNPALMLKVKSSNNPVRPAGDPGVTDGTLNDDLGGEVARVPGSALAATIHAQRRQMREGDRTSSSQTNMRRKVVGRHSGAAAQGPVTDEATLPAPGSPTVPAPDFVKVTLDSHLVHRAAHIPRMGAEGEKGEGPATHPPAAEEWLLRPSGTNGAAPETEHQAGHIEPPDHRYRTKRNSGVEKIVKTYRIAVEGPWLAAAQRVNYSESRRSGVKWAAMGKVFDGEEAAQQHQVIPSKRKVQENEYLKIKKEEEEEEEKEVEEKERLRWANDGDHGVRDNPPDGGSDRKEERRPMTETVRRAAVVPADARDGLNEDAKHTAVKSPPEAPLEMQQVAPTQGEASEVLLPREVITREAPPLHFATASGVGAQTKTAMKIGGSLPSKLTTNRPDPPLKAAAAREEQKPEWQRPDHPRGLVASRLLPPPRLSPLSVASRPDSKERDQFSSGTDHSVRGSESPRLSALQQRRGPQGKDPWGGTSTAKTVDQVEQGTNLQRFRGRVKKRSKIEKLKVMSKPEQNEGEEDKGRQEMRGGDVSGGAASRHDEEQEVGYKENYLTSGVGVKVAEDDANDAYEVQNDVGSASEARQVARTSRPPAHQHGDSAHTPVSFAIRSPAGRGGVAATSPEALAAAGLPWDERERRQSTVRDGGGRVRGSEPSHSLPVATRPPRPQLDPAVFSSSTPLEYQGIPTASSRGPHPVPSFRVLDYHEYKKLYMAQPDHRKIDSHATSEPDRSTGNPTRKAGWRESEGRAEPYGVPPHRADGKASNHTTEDGMGKAALASQSSHARLEPADHLAEERDDALTLSPPASRLSTTATTSIPTGIAQYTTQKNAGWNAVKEAGGGWGVGSGLVGGGQGEAGPRGFPRRHPPLREGQARASRGPGYIEEVVDFVKRKGSLPDFGCRSVKWEDCDANGTSTSHIKDTITHTLGDSSSDSIMNPENTQDRFVTYESQITVLLFRQLTSTGTHNPVLVLYMDLLSTSQNYILYLNTHNTLTNKTGRAKQLIEFSPAPTLKQCEVIPLSKAERSYFRASCSDVEGQFYPVVLEWSYRFLRLGAKTVFYHGARTSFDFTLPPGMDSNEYRVYISVKAIDGKGVSYKYPDFPPLKVLPRSGSVDGVLSIFQEISTLENESPPLLLQQVRSLAWELNILQPSCVTQTVLDNILTILFYRTSCKDMLKTAPHSLVNIHKSSSDLFVEVNLLKSCARDHLAEKVVSNPIRDEMEVIQALTALQIIIDAKENISETTYLRVWSSMNTAAERMGFSYFAETRTEAAQEYFILSSAMLDKQTEVYDGNTTSVNLTTNIITQLLDLMEIETSARVQEEKPLTWSTSTLTFYGYWAESENINKWKNTVPFLFEPSTVVDGIHLVQALVHTMSPFNLPADPITSEVVYLNIFPIHETNPLVQVTLRHSLKRTGPDYDFRRNGVISPESLSVYEFVVENEQRPLVLNVLLQVTRVLNSQYLVAAVVLICNDLQNQKEPLYKQELMATAEPSEVMLSVPPNGLSTGKKLLIIMDKNSYENNWGRYNTSSTIIGADFKVSAWWSRCLVWVGTQWDGGSCSVNSKLSSWDSTVCSCNSKYSVYGAQTIPVLDEESKVDVNELMLHETYIALYFIMLLLVVYFLLALAVQTSDRHRLRRRNIWLRDNKLEHEWAYLLTIKTGTQWNAGTTSKVYAILHGTHGMSETRELQSKQTGQLFTRGALCTFILTTPEPLGDILKVQVWHDNSGGSESGWFVCETSVADLVLGAIYIYPCYRWLSVQAEDAKVEREITLESPTTFLQDFEHFLPQYASEHMLWTSLLTTSSTAKLYRLQRLTICLIVCLCLGTVSLGVVKRINKEHTMMVPDIHIEPLYYGIIIAVVLLPVQWVLEMIFKMSNKVEEKEYNAKAVLDTLRATKSDTSTSTDDTKSTQVPSDSDDDIYDPQAEIWRNIRKWSLSTEVSSSGAVMLHPTLLRDLEIENMEVTQRSRSSMGNISKISQSDSGISAIQPESLPPDTLVEAEPNEVDESSEESDKKCAAPFLWVLPKFLRPLASWCLCTSKIKNKQYVQEDWEAGEDEDYEDDEDAERDDLRVASSITFIFSQCVGWIVCCIFVALCCMVLYVHGSGMPMDYGALWIHIIYVTLCCSVFVMQPLVVIIYTFYKVCVYRWLGCRGCISSCITVPLDQVVDIWNRYQTALRRQTPTIPDSSNEKLLEERQRTRDLRSAHPPSEDYLLKCREKEIRREKVYSLFRNTLGHLAFLVMLIIIANNVNIYKRFTLNRAILSSLKNGSCLDSARYEDPCTLTNGDFCNQIPNEDYLTFDDIKTKDDWWNWTYTELLALTYSNHDESFSAYNIFCDSNSIIIGQPRLRKYDSSSQKCEASKFKIDSNRSMADLLKIGNCFPDYVDEVPHLFSFGSNLDKEYEWDAHFLAVTHGQYSQYSYTSYKQALPSSRFGAFFMLYLLQASNWLNNNGTRAVVTEFTLYHPQTNMYTTLNLLAEFPSLSGAEVTTFISSSHIERYEGSSSAACTMLAETFLLAVAMYYLKKGAVYIYTCRFRIWKSFWGLLDVLMTIMSWSYIVCLMLRVQIAEDAMWQLRVAYFQKFVNLKGLTTWDEVLECLIGCMLTVHLLRCLSLLKYLPRSYHLGLVLASAWKDVKIISVCLLVLMIAFMCLGHTWFNTFLWEFHSNTETVLTIFKMIMARLPFLITIEEQSTGSLSYLGYLYYLLTYVFLYQLMRALYVAAFLNARRSFIDKPGLDVTWNDVSLCMKERYQSLLRRIRRKKKEEESQPADNTPPDFYMAELELQINQVMSGLESLAESLGLVVDRMNRLEDTQSSYSDLHNTEDDNYSYSNDEVWQEEDSESRSSIFRTEEETKWEFLQHQQQQSVRDYDCKLETNHFQGAIPRLRNEAVKGRKISVDKGINLDAFTDIESCQTEIEALTHKWNLALGDPSFELIDDGGTLEKFLKDVSESFDNFTSFGKYGKTQLRVNTRIHPSHESLNLSHNNSGVTESIAHQKGIHTDNADGSVPRGISSRLCRTQTQGRGKGHVEALDISCLESDHEDEGNY